MRRGWSYLTLLFFLTPCASAQRVPLLKGDRSVSIAAPEHGEKADLQVYLARLSGKSTYTAKDCASISIPSDSLFEPHSDEVKPVNWEAPIGTVAAVCERFPETKVIVSAYTDCLNSEEHNMALSELQAWMIKKALVDKGIASRKIIAEGWGESRPVASNATEEGRKANRRITIIFCPDLARSP